MNTLVCLYLLRWISHVSSCKSSVIRSEDNKNTHVHLVDEKELEIPNVLRIYLEIRSLSKELGLSTWDKPPYACLLTRMPYGNELKEEDFAKIEKAEKYLMDRGFRAAYHLECCHDLAYDGIFQLQRGWG